jgi:hypothetical protein
MDPVGMIVFSAAILACCAAIIMGAFGLNQYSENRDAEETGTETEIRS